MTVLTAIAARRLVVIYNPAAGQRRQRFFRAVLGHLEAMGLMVDLVETRGPGHATEIARSLAAGACRADMVVAAGGDGTINEIINGLAGGSLPLGLIPLGTAHVLALELGLPRTPGAIAQTLAAGLARPIHLGRATSALGARHFVMMAGVGYDAHVVAGVSRTLKRRVGKLAYVVEMLRQLGRFHFRPYRLAFDGAAPVEAASAILANGRRYGGAFVCAPQADLGLERLDACLFGRGGRLAAVGYGFALGLDLIPRLPSVVLRPFREVAIDGPAGDPVQGDGDIVATLPARITVAEAELMVVAPAVSDSTAPVMLPDQR
jgi:diacylglycerol kinase family enzyme